MFKKIMIGWLSIQPFIVGALFASDGMAILAASDNYRSPFLQSKMEIAINTLKNNAITDSKTYTVYYDVDKTLVEMTSGRNSGDRALLTNRGMFIAVKKASRPVRITPLQRLIGQASYGDLATLKLTADYTAKILKEEENAIVLELNAKSKRATYVKIHLWVNKKNHAPQKAEAFLASGKLFKQISYVLKDGQVSKMIYYSPNLKNSQTEMVFKSVEAKKLPKRLFTSGGMRGKIK